jgi:hypothetical protein
LTHWRKVLGSTESLSQQSVKGNKFMLRTPFKGNQKHTDDSLGTPRESSQEIVGKEHQHYNRTL